jgi:hypothetical protein
MMKIIRNANDGAVVHVVVAVIDDGTYRQTLMNAACLIFKAEEEVKVVLVLN